MEGTIQDKKLSYAEKTNSASATNFVVVQINSHSRSVKVNLFRGQWKANAWITIQ